MRQRLKDIFQYRFNGRRVAKKLALAGTLMASFAVVASAVTSAVTVAHPNLVSEPIDDYAARHGIKQGLQQHFATKGIRVYDRDSWLMPFHRAGRQAQTALLTAITVGDVITLPPMTYAETLWTAALNEVGSPNALDAFSLRSFDLRGNMTCFIRPAGEIDSATWFYQSTQSSLSLTFADSAEIKLYYKAFVLAHEGRHCDQDLLASRMLYESDADLFAHRFAATLVPSHVAADTSGYLTALRVIYAGLSGDTTHYTTPAVLRDRVVPMQAIEDNAVMIRFLMLASTIESQNRIVFATQPMEYIEMRYHTARKILAAAPENDQVTRYPAGIFVDAVDHLNASAGGKLITVAHDKIAPMIDVSWLTREYQPVSVPQAKPIAPKPSAGPQAGS